MRKSYKPVYEDGRFFHRSVELYPTEEQKEYLNKCISLYRYVYNWALEQKETQLKLAEFELEESSYISEKEMKQRFQKLRQENNWLQVVPAHLLRYAVEDAINAYENYFNKNTRRPKFKSKKRSKQSFSTSATKNCLYFFEDKVHIEGLPGYRSGIKTKIKSGYKTGAENPSNMFNARIILNNRGQYILNYNEFLPFNEYKEDISYNSYDRAIGIDVNTKNLIVTSYNDGEIFKAPDVEKYKKQLIRRSRKHEKDVIRYRETQKRTNSDKILEKSKNSIKRQIKLAKTYHKIECVYDTYIHTTVKQIVKRNPKAIVLESLDTVKMRSKETPAFIRRSLGTFTPFAKIRQRFIEKCDKYNVPIIFADSQFPSTKRCSCCGNVYNVRHNKTYKCPTCGLKINRDINAALNLESLVYA